MELWHDVSAQRDDCLAKSLNPRIQIYKPSRGHILSFVFIQIIFLVVTPNYSRVESKKITENPTN